MDQHYSSSNASTNTHQSYFANNGGMNQSNKNQNRNGGGGGGGGKNFNNRKNFNNKNRAPTSPTKQYQSKPYGGYVNSQIASTDFSTNFQNGGSMMNGRNSNSNQGSYHNNKLHHNDSNTSPSSSTTNSFKQNFYNNNNNNKFNSFTSNNRGGAKRQGQGFSNQNYGTSYSKSTNNQKGYGNKKVLNRSLTKESKSTKDYEQRQTTNNIPSSVSLENFGQQLPQSPKQPTMPSSFSFSNAHFTNGASPSSTATKSFTPTKTTIEEVEPKSACESEANSFYGSPLSYDSTPADKAKAKVDELDESPVVTSKGDNDKKCVKELMTSNDMAEESTSLSSSSLSPENRSPNANNETSESQMLVTASEGEMSFGDGEPNIENTITYAADEILLDEQTNGLINVDTLDNHDKVLGVANVGVKAQIEPTAILAEQNSTIVMPSANMTPTCEPTSVLETIVNYTNANNDELDGASEKPSSTQFYQEPKSIKLMNVSTNDSDSNSSASSSSSSSSSVQTSSSSSLDSSSSSSASSLLEDTSETKEKNAKVDVQIEIEKEKTENEAQKEEAELQAQKQKEETEHQAREERKEAERQAQKEREEAELIAKQQREEAELQAQKEREEAELLVKQQRQEAERQAQKYQVDITPLLCSDVADQVELLAQDIHNEEVKCLVDTIVADVIHQAIQIAPANISAAPIAHNEELFCSDDDKEVSVVEAIDKSKTLSALAAFDNDHSTYYKSKEDAAREAAINSNSIQTKELVKEERESDKAYLTTSEIQKNLAMIERES